MSVVKLSAPGVRTVRLDGGGEERHRILVSLSGWLGSPDAKVHLSERESGDGAHDIPVSSLQYSTRTVQIAYRLKADSSDRNAALDLLGELKSLLHRSVRVEVDDAKLNLYCTGYVSQLLVSTTRQTMIDQTVSGTLDIVCPRPELLSVDAHSWQLGAQPITATQGTGVGLRYSAHGVKSVVSGLSYPLRYAEEMLPTMNTTAVLTNNGTSRAYPVFTCNGPLPHGVRLSFSGRQMSLACSQPVYGVPLVLDCRSRSAEMGGLDVSRTLTSRGFPVVEPGGSLTVSLSADGTGWVDCRLHDTYM